MTATSMLLSPVMLPLVATPYVPQASCLTTEPPRRSSTLALGLLPPVPGARSPQGSCPGLVQPRCEGSTRWSSG